ncbi:hypothetical protein C8Q80DRAFT_1275925 [Daedaleopsis nitida]|nr:hypothetical protein C8Q80DRAFT_1275925 [Daedaleopsis nitida]
MSDIRTLTAKPLGTHLEGANDQPTQGAVTLQVQGLEVLLPVLLKRLHATGQCDTYKLLVGRSENVSGPYVDKDGHKLTEALDPPAGSLVLGSHGNIYAAGGQTVFADPVDGATAWSTTTSRPTSVSASSTSALDRP